MTSTERQQLLTLVASAFLGGSGTNRLLGVHLAGHPELNVEISATARGLRTVIGQGQRGRARALPVAGADAKLLAMGFAGGGQKGNYRSYSTPTVATELAAMIDQLMAVAFDAQPNWEPEIASNEPGVLSLLDQKIGTAGYDATASYATAKAAVGGSAKWPLPVDYGTMGLSDIEKMTDEEYAAAVEADNMEPASVPPDVEAKAPGMDTPS